MKRLTRSILLLAATAFYFLFLRGRMNTWGTKGLEADDDLPGDWLIGDRLRATRALTILRSPDEIWPWLAQMGRGAGYYVFDYICNGNCSSANYLLPDLPEIKTGDCNKRLGYVESIEKKQSIVWVKKARALPFASLDIRYSYILLPLGLGASRFLVRTSLDYHGPLGMVAALLFEPLTFIYTRTQLTEIKNLVESYNARKESGQLNNYLPGKHQSDIINFV